MSTLRPKRSKLFGLLVQLVRTLARHARDHRFKSGTVYKQIVYKTANKQINLNYDSPKLVKNGIGYQEIVRRV
ncbi:unnamed protein product [marine sediment metagenome]|uniref:Uncharacterized protein n=1 Tax=marine sediment metagenome TaxID=412755 RepID=X0XET8_9ZZZZ